MPDSTVRENGVEPVKVVTVPSTRRDDPLLRSMPPELTAPAVFDLPRPTFGPTQPSHLRVPPGIDGPMCFFTTHRSSLPTGAAARPLLDFAGRSAKYSA